jgi:hypothetical protein
MRKPTSKAFSYLISHTNCDLFSSSLGLGFFCIGHVSLFLSCVLCVYMMILCTVHSVFGFLREEKEMAGKDFLFECLSNEDCFNNCGKVPFLTFQLLNFVLSSSGRNLSMKQHLIFLIKVRTLTLPQQTYNTCTEVYICV